MFPAAILLPPCHELEQLKMSKPSLDFTAHAMKAAKLDLVEMARAGMAEQHSCMYDLEVVAHGTRKKYRDSIFSLLPRSYARQQDSCCGQGIFRGLLLGEILEYAFTPEAVDFLIEHSYNPYVFWSNIYDTVFSLFREDTAALPLDLETVKKRIIGENTPFGVVSSPFSDLNMGRLKAAAKENQGKFDPNKLPAAYAFDLIRAGFLFRQKLEDYRQPSVLVVNPMWQHLLDDLVETASGEGESASFTLSAHGEVAGSITIEPAAGYTAEQIAKMLSQRHAYIKDGEVVVNKISPQTGYTVIAKIKGDSKGELITSTPVWTVIR